MSETRPTRTIWKVEIRTLKQAYLDLYDCAPTCQDVIRSFDQFREEGRGDHYSYDEYRSRVIEVLETLRLDWPTPAQMGLRGLTLWCSNRNDPREWGVEVIFETFYLILLEPVKTQAGADGKVATL
jgi:hypothetical protein